MSQDTNDSINSLENLIEKELFEILDILLIDRTTSTTRKTNNIIWATDNYIKYGRSNYAPTTQIRSELIIDHIIMPRALKSREDQKERTKAKAEVFTPTWIVKKQNETIEHNYLNDDLETYVKRKWLEITCGEAPYMATRYDMETGSFIALKNRVGFVDKKLQRINAKVTDKAEWQRLVEEAYKASYGFEWSGDSLLLARTNLLYTYRDYYFAKWKKEPIYGLFKDIAEIISYNLFQMDGLKYTIPLTEREEKIVELQMSLFGEKEVEEQRVIHPGKRVRIMNWGTKKMEYFNKGIK